MIAIIVPCRLNSTRFPKKLLHPVFDKPLVRWTAERIALEVPEIPLYFAVDSSEFTKALKGFEVIHTSSDHTCGTDRIAEANEKIKAEYIINIQADEPMVTAAQIGALQSGLVDYRMTTLASPEDFDRLDLGKVKVVRDYHHRALYFTRAPIPHALHHIGMYGYEAGFLETFRNLEPGIHEKNEGLEQLRALEHGYPIGVELTHDPHIEINTAEDIWNFIRAA